jgi:hypothetical protein
LTLINARLDGLSFSTILSIPPPGAPLMPIPRASQALSRFTVLDLTRLRSGPTCVRQLADWGANVVKIDALMEDAAKKPTLSC